jgi:hypothetical protein
MGYVGSPLVLIDVVLVGVALRGPAPFPPSHPLETRGGGVAFRWPRGHVPVRRGCVRPCVLGRRPREGRGGGPLPLPCSSRCWLAADLPPVRPCVGLPCLPWSCQALKKRFAEVLPAMQKNLKELLANHGNVPLGSVTIDQCVGGGRGIPCILWETSLLNEQTVGGGWALCNGAACHSMSHFSSPSHFFWGGVVLFW